MRITCLACEALARPVYLAAAHSPHTVDVHLLRMGLHSDSAALRTALQEAIDAVDTNAADAVAIAYGLCGKATEGLCARNTVMAVPRAHDCITLFLGSRERYQKEFTEHPGTYWYSADYVERMSAGDMQSLSLGSAREEEIQKTYREFVQTYGEDNAAYLMEAMGAWQDHYDRAAFIDLELGGSAQARKAAEDEATRRGWRFDTVAGSILLVRKLLAGDWDDDILVLQPGQRVAASFDDNVIDAR